jgi:hypothetical protein
VVTNLQAEFNVEAALFTTPRTKLSNGSARSKWRRRRKGRMFLNYAT